MLGDAAGPAAAALRAALLPAAVLYGLGMRCRNGLFDAGLRRAQRLPVPVIAVGNLSVGGTGKTPMVEWVVRRLLERGRRPAILSRGYGARATNAAASNTPPPFQGGRMGEGAASSHHAPPPNLPPQAEGGGFARADTTAGGAANEEAALLAENLAGVPHFRSPDRVAAGRRAIAERDADALVLDDGFQHRRLHRDLDIVLIDALAPPQRDHLFPAGSLREPASSLRRAQVVVLTRGDLCSKEDRAALRAFAHHVAPQTVLVEAVHEPTALRFADGRVEPVASLRDRAVFAFCGIGNPRGFLGTLDACGARVAGARIFPDHHDYGEGEAKELADAALAVKAEIIVTTQKDLVKLRGRAFAPPLAALIVALKIVEGSAALEEKLSEVCPPCAL